MYLLYRLGLGLGITIFMFFVFRHNFINLRKNRTKYFDQFRQIQILIIEILRGIFHKPYYVLSNKTLDAVFILFSKIVGASNEPKSLDLCKISTSQR